MSTNVDVAKVDIAKVDLVSLAILFVCIVALVLSFIAIVQGGSLALLLAPTTVGVWAILNLRR
jgi:hypothetical protein